VLLLALSAVIGCRHRVVVSDVDRANCTQEVTDAFGDQGASVIAVRARDRGPLFRPAVLEAVDRVCQAFEDEMTDDLVAVKCLTNLPIMEGRPAGARVVVARDEFPMSPEQALTFQALVHQLEFAWGDVIDQGGAAISYIHLPTQSFDGVDVRATFDQQVVAELDALEMVLDDGTIPPSEYRAIAADGPSSRYLVGLFDAGEAGGLKEPAALLAMARFQEAAEANPRVAQTFSIADDLKVVRRGLHKGNPADAIIPLRRTEVAQLLLALSMAPSASSFGPRMDTSEQVALLRVNLAAGPPEAIQRIGRRLDALLGAEAPEGGRAFLCLDAPAEGATE